MKKIIKIDIVSDVVCPWCYIGKRRLEKAIEQVADKFDVELEYHPFELNPEMPQAGVDQREYLSNKFGGEERYEQLTEHTASIAAAEGLNFDFGKQHVSPNTRNIHAVIQLAKAEDKQLFAIEAFFRAYFTEGVDLSKKENILAVAVTAGLNKEKVEKCLNDDESKLQVALAEKEMYKLGITGVPFYIINNKYGVSGAQLPETFVKAFEEISLETVAAGEACDIDGKRC